MVDELGEHFVGWNGGFWWKLTVWGLECGMKVLVLVFVLWLALPRCMSELYRVRLFVVGAVTDGGGLRNSFIF